MAEFALGLTKTAVEGAVSRVKSAFEEEKKLKVRVQNDLVFITGEFQMMQSFLNVANAERVNNQVVRTWVRQIRDLAFDVEDCLEFVVHLDRDKSGWLWRVLPACMAPPRPLDQAVEEIKQLKSRVEDVSQRNTRYNLINDSGTDSNSKPATVVVASQVPELMPAAAAFDILREVWRASGKHRGTGELKNLINSQGRDLEVIALWESPGSVPDLGVTQVIREAYNDRDICQEFKMRAWVKLTHPFNQDEFLRTVLIQFYACSHRSNLVGLDYSKKMKAVVAMEDEVVQQVSQQRYLVVVEQLSTMVEWDAITMFLPDNKNGSRIVVTTQQLGLALSCTGSPYQVLELGQFAHGQYLCAFFRKVSGRRSDMGEFIWRLRCGGVISLWGHLNQEEQTLVNQLYTGITHKSKEFEGVEFDRQSWVEVPCPFNLGVFSRRLLLNLHSDDLRATKIAPVAVMMDDTFVIQGCCRFLREDNCLVIINGLNSRDDWDLIKSTFISELNKGSILVITMEKSVATHCVDEEDRVLNVNDLDGDNVLHHCIELSKYYGMEDKEASSRGNFFSNRKEEACEWTKKFELIVDPTGEEYKHLWYALIKFNPGVIFVYGITGAWRSALARRIYYDQILGKPPALGRYSTPRNWCLGFTKFSWVDVPNPFDLTDFTWRLFLDFHSDDLEAKETAAVCMMEGCQAPIEECLKFLRQEKCFVVLRGLQSANTWDLIRDAFLNEPIKGCILVVPNEVTTNCPSKEEGVLSSSKIKYHELYITGKEAHTGRQLFAKKEGYSDKERSHTFSQRMVEARDYNSKFELFGHHYEWASLHTSLVFGGPTGRVTSVWGIAGVGKSTLVRSLYYNDMIGLSERDDHLDQVRKYSWVDVPQPFNLKDLSRRLLIDFYADDLEAKETVAIGIIEGRDPIQGCRKILQEGNYFVVFDGLCSVHDWDLIKAAFLSDPIKDHIYVITNEESVALHCGDEDGMINIKCLELDAAVQLFTEVVWGVKELTSYELELSKLTMAKCGGLSKVIAAIGDYCCASNRWVTEPLKKINDDFMGMLETNPRFHSLRSLFSWMQSYFDDCPDSLKPCIFYLSVFPLLHNIRRRRLLRRWIAEGYIIDTPGSTAEETGDKFLSELVKLTILQQQETEQPSKEFMYQVNGFFREFIISRPMQDNLVFSLEGHCNLNSQRSGQHLTISSSWNRVRFLLEGLELSRLRSFTVFGEWRSFFISADVNMRLLRVLDLEDASGVTDGDLEQIGKLQPRLKFLSLRGCKDITCLPSSLGGMKQLQTLDIKGTSIVMLPTTIIKLEKLQYVRAGTTQCISTSSEDDNLTIVEVETQQVNVVDESTSTSTNTSQPPAATPPPLDGNGANKSQLAAAVRTPQQAEGDDADTSQPSPTTILSGGNGDGASASQPPDEASTTDDDEARRSTPRKNMERGGLVFSWFSKLHRQEIVSKAEDGVQFPSAAAWGIGKLTALHTLGVINVGCTGGKAVLREFRKLIQLRKLKLFGINRKNWQDFCFAISGHSYLESLSVQLDEEVDKQHQFYADFSDISEPPKTLKTLKVYGGKTHISPVWLKPLQNLSKTDFDITISTQEEIDGFADLGLGWGSLVRLCLRPTEDGEHNFSLCPHSFIFKMLQLEIDCGSYRSQIVLGDWIAVSAVVWLVVRCSSTRACLEISGLEKIDFLKEVRLLGSYNDAVKQYLQQKLAGRSRAPVFKVENKPRPY